MKLLMLYENRWQSHHERINRLKERIDTLLGPVMNSWNHELAPAQEIWLNTLISADQLLDKVQKMDPLYYKETERIFKQIEDILNRVEQQRSSVVQQSTNSSKHALSKKGVSDYYTNQH